MAYISESETEKFIDDITRRKEFYIYKIDDDKNDKKDNIIPRFLIKKLLKNNQHLQLTSYQSFVSNYINPNTPYTRLLMQWQTGTGKTIGSLAIAMNFINYYKMESDASGVNIGSVFIIGFSSNQFKNELIRVPEFGFISKSEINKLNLLKKTAYNGNKFDAENLHNFLLKIKKRFSNRVGNGFFEFIGYKKLANDLFIIKDKSINISELNENGIFKAVADEKILLNKQLLNRFKNSLLICDEIHNTYNSLEKNNWGVALQYILNYHQNTRAVFLSATPINNHPSEIVDILNLLLPSDKYPRLNKSDLFSNDKQLKRDALDKITELSIGRISYLQDSNPIHYPTRSFIGEQIKGISYLKFIRCPMSPFHYNTYKNVFTGSLVLDNQYLIDFALPNPKNKNIGLYSTEEIKKELLYATQDWRDTNKISYINNRITGNILNIDNIYNISNKYFQMIKTIIELIKNKSGKIFIYHNVIQVSGVIFIEEILLQNNIIGEYDSSTDNTICSLCGEPRKKHKQITGGSNITVNNVLLLDYTKINNVYVIKSENINSDKIDNVIQELKQLDNPFIILFKNDTLKNLIKDLNLQNDGNIHHQNIYYNELFNKLNESIKNKVIKKSRNIKHNDNDDMFNTDHVFNPVRYIVAHSMLDRNKMNNSIDKYNSPDNSNGNRIMILIGGKIIKESYDLKAIREVMIMGRPDNIPTLIQILGRSTRKWSHISLKSKFRHVNVRIFTSCLPIKEKNIYKLSYEEDKYMKKIESYKIIQLIEKTLHENAIDSVINKNMIWGVTNKEAENGLGAIYYEPNTKNKNKIFTLDMLNLETFNIFYNNNEINNIIILLKRLFIEISTVWLYKDLLYAVKNANRWIELEFNPRLISEDLFIIALTRIVWSADSKYTEPIIKHINKHVNDFVDQIFDTDDKIIILPDNQKSVVVHIDSYYILFPINEDTNELIQYVETPYRITKKKEPVLINIQSILKSERPLVSYNDKRDRFFNKWGNIPISELELAVCEFGTDFHITFLEECIEYIFNVWTNINLKKSPMHIFYFKMINYYDLHKLVIWGNVMKPFMFEKYKKYLNQVKTSTKKNISKEFQINDGDVNEDSSGLINMLKSSINKSEINWISSGLQKQFDETLNESLLLFDGIYKKQTNAGKKINADIVPTGHFLNQIPKFYIPEQGWFESPEYLNTLDKFIENNIIIGYDERSKTGIHVRFKVRNPIQNIKQYKDSRLIEKGSVCSSKSKEFLNKIVKNLSIKIKDKNNVIKLCSIIRTKLIYLELKERLAGTKKKWFYFIYEQRPETII